MRDGDLAGEDGAVAEPVSAVGSDGAVEEGWSGGAAGGVRALDASDMASSDLDDGSGGGVDGEYGGGGGARRRRRKYRRHRKGSLFLFFFFFWWHWKINLEKKKGIE